MHVGRVLGRTILALLDALVAGAVTGFLGFVVAPVLWVGDGVLLGLTIGGIVAGVTLAASLALLGLGRRPFPATRLARTALDRVPWWWV